MNGIWTPAPDMFDILNNGVPFYEQREEDFNQALALVTDKVIKAFGK